ncbi:MAG: di-heme oxidoredictase family protein [Pseudomonadota bacterium]|nr:thiol oxidoreductase [Pseudomonadales bacterium]MDY6921583.1 di-heme oxidoredictase family protein [Pseudomonadota bacterium]
MLLACLIGLTANLGLGYGVNSGGDTSVAKTGNDAFSLPSANMSFTRRLDFNVGNSFFRNPWVIAPSTTKARDGLGALFNTNGCQNCHIRDGRGHLPQTDDDNAVSLLVRLSLKPSDEKMRAQVRRLGVIPHPVYGDQIQDFSIPGVKAEAQIRLRYETSQISLADGTTVTLQKPLLTLEDLGYGPLGEGVVYSLRLAPPVIGLGLLEAVPAQQIKQHADPEDANGDGISGRWNRVWDVERQAMVLGRFGWKAEQPTLKQQNAAAFVGDIGITSSLFNRENCTQAQSECQQAVTGSEDGAPEISDKLLNLVTFYTRNLAVPKRRNLEDQQVQQGQGVFQQAGCAGCHLPQLTTPKLAGQPEQSEQTFHPYTDMLLHDMGPGLADNREAYDASGTEWRTPPLWGIGLTEDVSGHQHYLHDGRARSLLEAVLWHDGEARASRDYVVAASRDERDALLAFLRSL